MSVLSIDLAYTLYSSIGVCHLQATDRDIAVTPIPLSGSGLTGKPEPGTLARKIAELATQYGARRLLIDGPQAWKAPDNGLLHSRACERQLATPGKTGLPGCTKPATYLVFTSFSIDLDQLTDLGWARLPNELALSSTSRFALESFPTAAWRSLGMSTLPAKRAKSTSIVQTKLKDLSRLLGIDFHGPVELTHDELQAVVAGLGGIAFEGHPALGVTLAGIPPFKLDGTWREGFIVNPVRRAAV